MNLQLKSSWLSWRFSMQCIQLSPVEQGTPIDAMCDVAHIATNWPMLLHSTTPIFFVEDIALLVCNIITGIVTTPSRFSYSDLPSKHINPRKSTSRGGSGNETSQSINREGGCNSVRRYKGARNAAASESGIWGGVTTGHSTPRLNHRKLFGDGEKQHVTRTPFETDAMYSTARHTLTPVGILSGFMVHR